MAIQGNYRIAEIQHYNGVNTKHYNFALFDKDVQVGDYVLLANSNGMSVGQVMKITDKIHYYGAPVTSEIVCKVDMTRYLNRQNSASRIKELAEELDKAVANRNKIQLYKAAAQNDPTVNALLNEYAELLGVNLEN